MISVCCRREAPFTVQVGFDPSCGFTDGKAVSHEGSCAPEIFVGDDRLASPLATTRRRRIETGTGSLADKVALELSERAENVKDEPAASRSALHIGVALCH